MEILIIYISLLISSPPDEFWIKLLVAALSGFGLSAFATSWLIVQSGKRIWQSIAADFILTQKFCDAVNNCRKSAEYEFIEKIRLCIEEHNKEEWPHGNWRHDHYNNDIARLELRIVQLEQKK